jgi:hypothetical protein
MLYRMPLWYVGSSFGCFKPTHPDSFHSLQAVYISLFASLLFFHEMTQFYPMEQVDVIVKRNFGFLFKPLGKGAFIVFIAFLNFGLTVNTNLGLATGICLCITGVAYICLFLRNPEFFDETPGGGGKANLPPYVPQTGV